MKTRTRSRNTQLISNDRPVSVYRDGTYVPWPWGGTRYVGAPRVQYETPVTDPIIPAALAGNRESITDEVDAGGRRIKYCDHKKWKSGGVVRRTVWTPNMYSSITDANGIYREWFLRYGENLSVKDRVAAWKQMAPHGLTSMDEPVESSLLSAVGSPTDRLGSVPARLVSAIEEWHASTSLIEMRDLPALAEMFKRRGPLGLSTTALTKWLASRNDLLASYRRAQSLKTIKALSRAYREGQLGYCFGLMPTVSDVGTISKVLSQGVKARQTRIVRTIRQDRHHDTKPVQLSWPAREVCSCTLRESVNVVRVDGGCAELKRPAYSNPTFDNMVKRLLGVNGANLIWEVLPFSFIVDWFLSVDDALDTIWLHNQTEYNVSFWSSTSLDYRRDIIGEEVVDETTFGNSNPPTTSWKRWDSPVWCEYSHYNRTLREFPTPLSSMRFRLGPVQGFLTALIALGLLPSKAAKRQ